MSHQLFKSIVLVSLVGHDYIGQLAATLVGLGLVPAHELRLERVLFCFSLILLVFSLQARLPVSALLLHLWQVDVDHLVDFVAACIDDVDLWPFGTVGSGCFRVIFNSHLRASFIFLDLWRACLFQQLLGGYVRPQACPAVPTQLGILVPFKLLVG